ncbi:hypothetical protein LSH36_2950g00006 [Paralvinella palmiformis]|uniref:Methionine adenosyltransferase 2 subunit beta n=1 Tax=Paralvinella palmiformis TaxID=53620 RepID=A0AAD9MJX4_9ANNE|nr:hypothetical protein LSH36_2950g00006 [Paralvinella palmiformis]
MGFRILITGASGLLGRALYRCFSKEKTWTILGLVLTRAGDDLKMVDITKTDELFTVMQEFKPDVVVHAAAERRPDIVEN